MGTGEDHTPDNGGRRWFPLTAFKERADGSSRLLSPAEMAALPSDTRLVVKDEESHVHWKANPTVLAADLQEFIANAAVAIDRKEESVVLIAPTGRAARAFATFSVYGAIEQRILAHQRELIKQQPSTIHSLLDQTDGYKDSLRGEGTFGETFRHVYFDECWPDPIQPENEEESNRDGRRKQAKLNFKDRAADSRDAKAAMRDRALAKLAKRKGSQ